MPNYRLIETTISDKQQALLPLLQMHAGELATHPALMRLAPNWDAYHALENTRALLALIAYAGDELTGDNEIIGYSINFIGRHLHYSGLHYAENDVLFVKPEHRGGKLGVRLMRETERLAKARGARMMLWHAKQGSALTKLLPRMDYAVQDIIYSKEI